MSNQDLTLQEIAQRAVDANDGKGGRALGRLAEQKGLTLSYTTVDRILAGTYTSKPNRATLKALSVLSGLDLKTVHRAAGVPLPQRPLADQLPEDADLLAPDARKVVIDLVRYLAKQAREQTGADDGTPTSNVTRLRGKPRPTPDAPETRAARRTGRKSRGQQFRDAQDSQGEN